MATRAGERRAKLPRKVSEGAREDEMSKYAPELSRITRFNNSTEPIPSSELSTCSDAVLTALCQLGACQTGTGRALLSLFDAQHQYIVAEAMPSLSLQPSLPSDDCPQPLWLCGTAIPRTFGVCEATVVGEKSDLEHGAVKDLPLTLSEDLTADARFCYKPYCQPGSLGRFYAAVPIRTPRGINIGVYCVIDETPGRLWTDAYTAHLRDISWTIMDHLESQRLGHLHRRNERMNRGLGSFVEGETTLSGWHFSPNSAAYVDKESMEGALNTKQQSLGFFPAMDTPHTEESTPPISRHDSPPRESYLMAETTLSSTPNNKDEVFSRAANIIRESIEVEGCVFYKPKASFHTRQNKQSRDQEKVWSYSSSSTSGGEANPVPETRSCHVLGFSTSELSSIDSALPTITDASMTEDFLAVLLRRYPQGAIFNFNAEGELLSNSSGDDLMPSLSASNPITQAKPTNYHRKISLPVEQHSRPRNNPSRSREGRALREAFPKARSVVFAPVWDSRKDGWYAGVFAYTNLARRSFTVQGELSYLRAFGAVTASEIQKLDTISADQAKSDALGSLSHELRSPLHGVLLSAELLRDTNMDVHQSNLRHIVETCSRTLLDTIDQLLDYSQINHFTKPSKNNSSVLTSSGSKEGQGQFGKKSLFSYVRLDGVLEEVVESVFAGFNFQHQSLQQASRATVASDVAAHQRLNSAQALEQIGKHDENGGSGPSQFGQVSVLLSIDSHCQWMYHVHIGAIRRIIMNLFGNALKYTSAGTITISLGQETTIIRRRKKQVVRISVQDTGKGMSTSFIEMGLFKPFSQEDSISPGTGLGLSLVKKITSQLHGQISIDSQVGVGTLASVILPLERAELPADTHASYSDDDEEFEGLVNDLKGLRIRIVTSDETEMKTSSAVDVSLRDICHGWLQMEIVSMNKTPQVVPDLVLWSHDASIKSPGTIEELSQYPNVVICPNILAAYHRNMDTASPNGPKLLEFVSQPIGPRKLAKVLSLAYRKWVELSHTSSIESITKPQTVPRPKGVKRFISSSVVSDFGALTFSPPSTERTDRSLSLRSSTPSSPIGDKDQLDKVKVATQCLLVDDNDINIKILSAIMKKLGIDYQTARNGKDAFETFSQNPRLYKCILMDISMPVMDGFEATRHIRALESYEGLRPVSIIALSGLSSDETHRKAFESGMDLFLTKPVKLVALGDVLKSRGIV